MKGQRFTVLLFTIGLFLQLSCARPLKTSVGIPSVTMSENTNRATLGLRQVGTNWCLYSSEFGEENWKIDPHGYEAKKIHRDSESKIQWEEDYYYSGKTFHRNPDSPTTWEILTVHYDYTTKAVDIEYVGEDPTVSASFSRITPRSTNKEKFDVADEILGRWGSPRL